MKAVLFLGVLAVMGFGGALVLALGPATAPVESADEPEYRVVVPALASDKFPPPPTPAPTPTPTPEPAFGQPTTLHLASGGVTGSPPIEPRHTIISGGREFFDVPSHPSLVAWYDRFGTLGKGGSTTLMAAHIDYVGYGAGPFARLTSARVGDLATVTNARGETLKYSVQSVQVIHLSNLDMNQVVYPALAPNKERLTLISCGGTFVPNPSGVGGQYESRVILVAERYVE